MHIYIYAYPLASLSECYKLLLSSTDFQGLILIFFNSLWKFHTQPSDWQLSLLQPIYSGHNTS